MLQGSNPVSDVWARHALGILRDYFQRSVFNPEDGEARSQMHMAAAFVGIMPRRHRNLHRG